MNMRMNPTPVLAASLCLLAAACGGSDAQPQTAADPAFVNAAPTYDSVALSVDDSDSAVPGASLAVDPSTGALTAVPASEHCHPHLFSRTREVVLNLNALGWKHLRHVDDLIGDLPHLVTGDSHTWVNTGPDGVTRQLTITKVGTGDFTFDLDLAPPVNGTSTPVFVDGVLTGSVELIAANPTSTPAVLAERKGTIDFDFTKLQQVYPKEPESGQYSYAFDVTSDPSKPGAGKRRAIDITFTAFKLSPNDPHGPRNGVYHFLGERGVGGTLSYQDTLILLCPGDNLTQSSDTVTEARWYKAADGSLHGRADAKAVDSAGSTWIPAGDTWMGVTCHQGPAPTPANENGYWMMKLEDSTGATVRGSAFQTGDASAPACDPVLGATVPTLTDSSTDWVFGGTLSFPGEW
jgi:hypothetical protein